MPPELRKLEKLFIDECSAVDYGANEIDGWLVMKSASDFNLVRFLRDVDLMLERDPDRVVRLHKRLGEGLRAYKQSDEGRMALCEEAIDRWTPEQRRTVLEMVETAKRHSLRHETTGRFIAAPGKPRDARGASDDEPKTVPDAYSMDTVGPRIKNPRSIFRNVTPHHRVSGRFFN